MTKKQLINEGKLEQALNILKSVADSNSVPRNIRKIVKESIIMLNDTETSISIRAANGTAEDGSILFFRVLVIKFIIGKILCSGAVIMSCTYFRIIGYVFVPKDVRKPSATVSG